MANNYNEKIIYGFKNIHVAKYNEATHDYDVPVKILGR